MDDREHADGEFPAADGYRLRYRCFPGVEPIKGVVACVHGIQSHSGWYTASCHHLAQAGYTVFFADRRGSGLNPEKRGHCSSFWQLRDDLYRYVEFVRTQVPDKPLTLLAISWGGKLVCAALRKRPELADGLILVCPGWFAKVAPTLREKLIIGWTFLIWPTRKVRVPLSDPELFTANPRWQQFLRDDPLLLRQATARMLMTSVWIDKLLPQAPPAITPPALLLLAGQDRIIDNGPTLAYFDRFAATDKTVREFSDAHHTLEFEPNPEPVFGAMVDWLDQRFAISSPS